MENKVARTLDEGWDYQPDWRSRVVDRLLVEKAGAEDPLVALQDEQDSYVRQYFVFRKSGESMVRDSMLWAHRAAANNRSTGAASLIKALTIAKVPVKDIAAKLRTSSKNIAVFVKLYFDVERYIADRDWIATVVFPTSSASTHDLSELRERRWLAASSLRGREGLERSLSPRTVRDSAERDAVSAEVCSILTARAHDFVIGMQDRYVPASADDFDRFVRMMDATARQPVADKRDELLQAFMQGINTVLVEKSKLPENAGDERLQLLREVNGTQAAEAQPAEEKGARKAG